jgi:hypothetical protein
MCGGFVLERIKGYVSDVLILCGSHYERP